MTENPYAAPAAPPPEPKPRKRKSRPPGVTVLLLLFIFPGMMPLIYPLQRFTEFSWLDLDVQGKAAVIVLVVGLLVLMSTAAGFWVGAKWSWKVGTLMYFYGFVRNLAGLIIVLYAPEAFDARPRGADFAITKYTIRASLALLFSCYMFKSNVLEFFGLAETKRLKYVAALLGLVLFIYIPFVFIAQR